jgi:ASC-1-like (ASCH) protein
MRTYKAPDNMNHLLKILPEYFEEVVKGNKTFEVRKNDRGFKVGEILILAEYCTTMQSFTGRVIEKKVTYILEGGSFGVEKGFVVMGLQNGFS